MESRAQLAIRRAPGTVSFYAKNLDSGASFGHKENEKVRTASTIKLPVMVATFGEVEAGRAKWEELLTLTKDEKVSGSGVIRELSDGVKLPLIDCVHLMIVVSDNTGTNLVLERIGTETVNQYMDKLGFKDTRVMRKILGDRNSLKPIPTGFSEAGKLEENKRFGIGSSTPKEMVDLLEKIDRGQVISPAACKEMIAILKRQQYQDGIARKLGSVPVASKSGALDALRSDVGIIYGKGGRIAMAITVDGMKRIDWSADNPGHMTIAELSAILLEGLSQPATLSTHK